jgi:hypothetical protein
MLAEGWDADNQTNVWFLVKKKYYAAEQKLILEPQKKSTFLRVIQEKWPETFFCMEVSSITIEMFAHLILFSYIDISR